MVFTPVLTQHQSKLSTESVETKVFIYTSTFKLLCYLDYGSSDRKKRNRSVNLAATGKGRKNETDYNVCRSLTSYLGHPKPSFFCVRKLFTIVNSLHFGTSFGMSPNGASSHSFCLSLYVLVG